MEKSIAELNLALEAGTVTSQELVEQYLARIEAYDLRGPALNAIVTLNPRVREDAAALDAERASGTVRSPLHGIPVLLKDNYDTHDMPTTAGVVALAASIPPDDAFQVRRLREAGVVILGKTNMHELARGITTVGSLTGQTRNPYDPTRNPGGSSGGTGAAVAASFAAVGMGSDTCGSIRIPSAHHALVGLRGTRGLASGDGIIPLSRTQDIGGPLARSVEDLALVLDATVGPDPSDPVTELSEGRIPEAYTAYLDGNALDGARIGVVLALMGESDAEQPVREVIEAAIETMRGLGAEFLDIEEPDLTEVVADASVIGQEFKFDLDAYLAGTPGAPVRSLEELVATGAYHEIVEGGLRNSLGVESLDTEEYRTRLERRDTARATIAALMEENGLDALLYPTIRQTARPVGDPQPGSSCAISAVSGLPAISVPAGYADDEMPVGLELLGPAFGEPELIAMAYAFEQATGHRQAPDFTPSLIRPPEPVQLYPPEGGVDGAGMVLFDPTTRTLRYTLGPDGIAPADILQVALHRGGEGMETGPVIRSLVSAGGELAGETVLTGRELRFLREGRLYMDFHTRNDPGGAYRMDLEPPLLP
ncbi:MAG: amidase family protein [Gammaproteobacteria bacterium]|nr:amidase family protein [Gammaproteobacteria bacterium]